MLENIYEMFNEKVKDKRKAWDYFIEFLAVDNCGGVIFEIGHKFEWLFNDNDLIKKVLLTYDSNKLRSEYHDHLGDMYLHHIVPMSEELEKARYIRHQPPAEELADLIEPMTKDITKFFDPVTATGRLLMAAHRKAPLARCFGLEKDLDLYRIAVTNFAIYSVPAYVLNIDISQNGIDPCRPLSKLNWKNANLWNPQSVNAVQSSKINLI